MPTAHPPLGCAMLCFQAVQATSRPEGSTLSMAQCFGLRPLTGPFTCSALGNALGRQHSLGHGLQSRSRMQPSSQLLEALIATDRHSCFMIMQNCVMIMQNHSSRVQIPLWQEGRCSVES